MKLIPMGNTHYPFSGGGQKTHIGTDDFSGKTLCGIHASYFHADDDSVDMDWIETGGVELCKKCANIAKRLLERQGGAE